MGTRPARAIVLTPRGEDAAAGTLPGVCPDCRQALAWLPLARVWASAPRQGAEGGPVRRHDCSRVEAVA